ncbi:MAG: hypothetical protein ACR2NP_10465 [Pirellulaceae bacterium]
MSRFVLPLFWLSTLLFVAAPQNLQGQVEPNGPITERGQEQLRSKLDDFYSAYETQLQAVLKTRLRAEENFVLEVVLQVQKEEIPKSLVDSAWIWVREKRPTTNHPFIYFERVLRLQGQKVDVAIPPFDRNIYSNRTRNRLPQNRERR